jgi:hypothetical protein
MGSGKPRRGERPGEQRLIPALTALERVSNAQLEQGSEVAASVAADFGRCVACGVTAGEHGAPRGVTADCAGKALEAQSLGTDVA